MCGIIGRVGFTTSPEKYLRSLKELEYRGYDSFGVLLWNKNEEKIVKDVGCLEDEEIKRLKDDKITGIIGHTRWATHGKVCKVNAHPHSSKSFSIVMNGIVENSLEIRDFLFKKGFVLESQTDTEVIPFMYEYAKSIGFTNLRAAKDFVHSKLKGEFSYLLKTSDSLLFYKNANPLLVGFSEKEVLFCSDSHTLQNISSKYMVLEDKAWGVVNSFGEVSFFDSQNKKFDPDLKSSVCEKFNDENITCFMEKEIIEQIHISDLFTKHNLEVLSVLSNLIKDKNIILTGAGTSYHAALMTHYFLLEKGIMSQTILASELNNYISLLKHSVIISFSQSGETADLISPLKELSLENKIVSIVNVKDSTLDRMSDYSVYLNCSREVSVASTKAFFFSVISGFLLAGNSFDSDLFVENFHKIIEKNQKNILRASKRIISNNSCFYLGRNRYYPLALEGALKLKEISYIHAEGFAGGELKHGSLALIEEGISAIVLGSDSETLSNAQEIKSRGGFIIGISEKDSEIYDIFFEVLEDESFGFMIVILQLLALHTALILDLNPDRPRNLAKSVTVK